jgi:hypothetical protein
VGSFIDPSHDKNVSNSSTVKTYEACGFNILCWLFGCCLSHKCCWMSHCTLIKKFDQVWCKLGFHKCSSQYASHPKCDKFANVATSKIVQLSFIPITTSLHFKAMIIKHKRYTWHLNVIVTLNRITFKWKQCGKKSWIITTLLRGKHSNGKQEVISILKP